MLIGTAGRCRLPTDVEGTSGGFATNEDVAGTLPLSIMFIPKQDDGQVIDGREIEQITDAYAKLQVEVYLNFDLL